MLGAALRDVAAALLRHPPVTVPAVGEPGTFAMLTDAASYRDYLAMMGPTWRNEVCARSLLGVPFNRPIRRAKDVRCPTMLVIASQDTIAPPAVVHDTARRIGAAAEVLELDCPHFDIYRGAHVERSITAQCDFLRRTLTSS